MLTIKNKNQLNRGWLKLWCQHPYYTMYQHTFHSYSYENHSYVHTFSKDTPLLKKTHLYHIFIKEKNVII